MGKSYLNVTDAELQGLKALWTGGPSSIRELTSKLYPAGGPSYYATVQKLLEQLEEKGCAVRDRSRKAHVFRAAVERGDLIDAQLQEMAERLCEGSLTPVLRHLVEGAKLSKRDRDTLRRLLDEAKQKRNKPGRQKP